MLDLGSNCPHKKDICIDMCRLSTCLRESEICRSFNVIRVQILSRLEAKPSKGLRRLVYVLESSYEIVLGTFSKQKLGDCNERGILNYPGFKQSLLYFFNFLLELLEPPLQKLVRSIIFENTPFTPSLTSFTVSLTSFAASLNLVHTFFNLFYSFLNHSAIGMLMAVSGFAIPFGFRTLFSEINSSAAVAQFISSGAANPFAAQAITGAVRRRGAVRQLIKRGSGWKRLQRRRNAKDGSTLELRATTSSIQSASGIR